MCVCVFLSFSSLNFAHSFFIFIFRRTILSLLDVQALKCEACEQPPEAHFYYYAHHSKQLTIRVKRLGNKKPLPGEGKLWMWSRCSKCEPNEEKATKRVLLSTAADALSFGKFLELSFSSYSSFNRLASCGHSFQKDFLYFFGYKFWPIRNFFAYLLSL